MSEMNFWVSLYPGWIWNRVWATEAAEVMTRIPSH